MATSGSEIVNSRTGQRTIFLQTAADTGGTLLRMETFHPPHGPAEPYHIHPLQRSRCELISGSLCFRIAGNEHIVKPGEAVDIPQGVPHNFWNAGNDEAHAIQEFRPALKIEDFFATYFTLANLGKLNAQGLPNPFLMAVIMQTYDQEIQVMKPPRFIQKLLMWSLAPLGQRLGYQGIFT